MKVETGAALVCLAANFATRRAMMKPTAGVGLVRRLVLREANVAVDSEHRALRIAADLRREAREPSVELFDELAHRRAHFVFILVAMRLEPGLVVVGL